ncbi:hypothetical protein G4L39_06450 [Limisphaera ngatamarikiensis]|uniref:Uncharacterized protein n=1 Tax=Limisphaera ngatamarikiensis TaxID=1324935 RepID=A0A6M1RHC7_9BACT|nr:hypothetical protein [Limisphaera ngatamarikiensis]NGO39036.1 hypothetical protein [Limisphaera ngatamarikiensis]
MRIIANTTELDGMLRRVMGRLERPEQALRAVGNLIYSLTLGAFDLSIGQRPAAWSPRRDGTVSKGRWFGAGPRGLLSLRTAGTPSLPWDLVGGTVPCARYSCGPRGRGPSQPVGARKGAL